MFPTGVLVPVCVLLLSVSCPRVRPAPVCVLLPSVTWQQGPSHPGVTWALLPLCPSCIETLLPTV